MLEIKIFVGVLYSGENEYQECMESIRSQHYGNFDLFKYEYLPKLEAHTRLYNAFLDQREIYNLLIKIDADMVLNSPTLFEKIVEKFEQNPWLEVFGIGITDFFSGEMINGLNSYRNTVKWELDPNNVNADVVIVDPPRYYFDKSELAPAAIHCKNPSKLQAFHFGVHRGIKSLAPKHSSAHWALLEKTWRHFLRTKDARIGLAVLGAELVYAGKFERSDVDYTNPRVKQELERYEPLDSQALQHEITSLRLRNWGFLPDDLRRRLLRKLRGIKSKGLGDLSRRGVRSRRS